jgi:hypothetical protein
VLRVATSPRADPNRFRGRMKVKIPHQEDRTVFSAPTGSEQRHGSLTPDSSSKRNRASIGAKPTGSALAVHHVPGGLRNGGIHRVTRTSTSRRHNGALCRFDGPARGTGLAIRHSARPSCDLNVELIGRSPQRVAESLDTLWGLRKWINSLTRAR